MTLSTCPKCGKFNVFNATQCPDCGANLEGDDRPNRGPMAELLSVWTSKNAQDLWCIVIGVVLIWMGIFVPQLGSAIIQIAVIFTEKNRHLRRAIEDDKPSAADSWWVIAAGLLSIGFGAFGLYSSWKSLHPDDAHVQSQE
jgi:hypothetical protein